jgi:lysophospholipase L1-like esterase
VVTVFGDSIAADVGLAPRDGLASQLEMALGDLSVTAAVRSAGVPGGHFGRRTGAARRGGAQGELYRQVSWANGVALYPDLFAGVGPELRQADRVHPNAAGARVIAKGLAPLVAEALHPTSR